MTLLLAISKRLLLPPTQVDIVGGVAVISQDDAVVSGTVLFSVSVIGLGQADGAWSFTASGPAAAKIGLSSNVGQQVDVKTTGAITGLTGNTVINVTWTGQGGSPVRNQSLTATIAAATPLAFNPSKLGWWTLLYYDGGGRNSRLRMNHSGQVRPYDGASVYMEGYRAATNPDNANQWAKNLNGASLWGNSKTWYSTFIQPAIASQPSTQKGLVLNVAVRWWNPRSSPNAFFQPHRGSFPALKADFDSLAICQNGDIVNSCYPIGVQDSDTVEQVRAKVADMWDKLGDGWFDPVIFAPWPTIIANIRALNLPFWKVIVRPIWEGNSEWKPNGKDLAGNVSVADNIENQGYCWCNTDEHVRIIKKAMKWYVDGLNSLTNGAGHFELALTPLRANAGPSINGQKMNNIIKLGASESPIFDYIGMDGYDRNINVGPGYASGTNSDRFDAFANDESSINYNLGIMASHPSYGYKLCQGEWNGSSGPALSTKFPNGCTLGPPASPISQPGENRAGCDNPTFVQKMWDVFSNNPFGFEMLFMPSELEYRMDVNMDTPAAPVYGTAASPLSCKPAASQKFHELYGLSYVP